MATPSDTRASTASGAPLARLVGWMLVLGLVLGATHGLRGVRADLPRVPLPAAPSATHRADPARTGSRTEARAALPEPRLRTAPVPLASVPRALIDATLATEDRGFYSHHGVAPAAFVRAAVANVTQGRTAQGGSTITMQLARNLYLTHERTLGRKFEEAQLAMKLERAYSKDQILALYLGSIYYGEGATGAREAAQRYYGKPLRSLTLGECAMLAGIPANPTLYSPLAHPERAVLRREKVLRNMLDTGAISPSEYGRAMLEPVSTRRR